MSKKLAIYGSGGLGREVFDIALRRNAISSLWKDIIFVDDFRPEETFYSTKSYYFDTILKDDSEYEFLIAIGEPSIREALFVKVKNSNFTFATLIDPTALISPTAKIGEGSIIFAFSFISSNTVIGKNCVVQLYGGIGHDIVTGEHCVFCTHFVSGGGAVIGNKVFCGMQSSVKEGLIVGDNAILAMGAAVFQDIPNDATLVGNPARITKRNDENKVFK